MIDLKEITWENFWKIINLKPSETQREYLPSNAIFMAQAYVNLKFNYPDVCFALYNGSKPVGFTKIVYVPKDTEPYYFSEDSYMVDSIMIDNEYQGKGYGKAAISKILEYIKSQPLGEANSIKLLCYDENTAAINIYNKEGFHKTNQFTDKEKGLRIYTKSIRRNNE